MPERIEWTEHRVQLPKNRWARHQGDVKAFAATVADRNYVAHHSENGWEICEDTVAGWQARGYVKGHIVDGLATRRDLDLVLEADSRGLRRVLKEHLTEGYIDAGAAAHIAYYRCQTCEFDIGGFANVGEASAAGRDHWRGYVKDAIAEHDLEHAA